MKARHFRWLFNFYPPYLGAGVKIDYINDDWREMQVSMRCRWYNRNYVGTHFGGSLYSMVDPHLMLLLIKQLGPDYIVWDKQADINFIKATRKRVSANIAITDAQLQAIREHTQSGEKYLPEFVLDIKDDDGTLIAQVQKVLYVRKKR